MATEGSAEINGSNLSMFFGRTQRLSIMRCVTETYTEPKTRHTCTGRVREIPHPTNDETDSNVGRIRLTTRQTAARGRVRETPLPTNDKTGSSTEDEKDYSKWCVR